MPLEAISDPNRQWGICGFCSALAAMYSTNPAMRGRIQGAIDSNQFRTRLLAEVKTFLVLLRATGKGRLIDEITTFNRRWYPDGFDYLAYISRVDAVVGGAFSANPQYTLALTPDALVYYLKEICGFRRVRWLPSDMGEDGILGLCTPGSTPLLERLAHWVYRENGIVYNWGAGADAGAFNALLARKSWRVGVHVLID